LAKTAKGFTAISAFLAETKPFQISFETFLFQFYSLCRQFNVLNTLWISNDMSQNTTVWHRHNIQAYRLFTFRKPFNFTPDWS